MILQTICFFRLFIGLGLLIMAGSPLYAQSVTDVYEARVLIENSDEGSPKQDLQRALTQILIKLTGNHKIFDIKPALKQVTDGSHYVEHYQYDTIDEQDYLIATFHAPSLSDLLQQHDLKIWSSNRPDFIAWILVEADGKQEILNSEMQQEAIRILTRQAKQRGLPVLLPLMDFEDHRMLKISDIIEGNKIALLQATERYGAGAILAGQVIKTFENQWQSKWRVLAHHEDEKTWEATYPSLDQALIAGIDEAVDVVALKGNYITVVETSPDENALDKNETQENPETTFELQVVNVLSLNDYSQVSSYLHKLDIITSLQMKDMSEGKVTFSVRVQGGREALVNALSLGDLLTPSLEDSQSLVYQFMPN
jgi:hypothetical protein